MFIGFPYGIFSEIALRIANEANDGIALSLINANANLGYFATETELCHGGYEVEMFRTSHFQTFVDNADWHLITETLKNINEV